MKWLIARVLIAFMLAAQFQITSLFLPGSPPPARAAVVSPEVLITISASWNFTEPKLLTLTDLGLTTVSVNWTAGDNATYTMIRGSRISCPTDIDEGELVYYGPDTSCNITGLMLDTNYIYVTATSFQSDNITHSNYIWAVIGAGRPEVVTGYSLGSESMTELTQTVNDTINYVYLLISIGIIGLITIFAFWKKEPWLYLLSGIGWLYVGFAYTSTDWRMAMLLVLLGMGCIAKLGYDYKRRKEKA